MLVFFNDFDCFVFTDIGGYNRIVLKCASHIMGLREIQVLIQDFTRFFNMMVSSFGSDCIAMKVFFADFVPTQFVLSHILPVD